MHRVYNYHSGQTVSSEAAQTWTHGFKSTFLTSQGHSWDLSFPLGKTFLQRLWMMNGNKANTDCQPQLCSCPCFTGSPASPEVAPGFLHFIPFRQSSGYLKSPRQSTALGKLLSGQCSESRGCSYRAAISQVTHMQLSPSWDTGTGPSCDMWSCDMKYMEKENTWLTVKTERGMLAKKQRGMSQQGCSSCSGMC